MNALFVGRFQPFHNGHLAVLEYLSKEYDQVIIGLGSSQYAGLVDNPFSAEEREQMIRESLLVKRMTNYRIVRIPDIHDPPRWVDHVLRIVSDFDVVVTNNELTEQLFSEKGFHVEHSPLFDREQLSGESIRQRIAEGKPWESLVPKPVLHVIEMVAGVHRIQFLMKKQKKPR